MRFYDPDNFQKKLTMNGNIQKKLFGSGENQKKKNLMLKAR